MIHWLKFILNGNYRAATKLANQAMQLETDKMLSSGAVKKPIKRKSTTRAHLKIIR